MKYRVKATKTGKQGSVLRVQFPVAMSKAIPGDSHWFNASFVDKGILLEYVGPAEENTAKPREVEPTPKWVKANSR